MEGLFVPIATSLGAITALVMAALPLIRKKLIEMHIFKQISDIDERTKELVQVKLAIDRVAAGLLKERMYLRDGSLTDLERESFILELDSQLSDLRDVRDRVSR